MVDPMNIKLVEVVDLSHFSYTQAFIALTSSSHQHLELRADRWVVDAKSIMGIFSLDVSKPVELWAEVANDAELKSLKDMFAQFKA